MDYCDYGFDNDFIPVWTNFTECFQWFCETILYSLGQCAIYLSNCLECEGEKVIGHQISLVLGSQLPGFLKTVKYLCKYFKFTKLVVSGLDYLHKGWKSLEKFGIITPTMCPQKTLTSQDYGEKLEWRSCNKCFWQEKEISNSIMYAKYSSLNWNTQNIIA